LQVQIAKLHKLDFPVFQVFDFLMNETSDESDLDDQSDEEEMVMMESEISEKTKHYLQKCDEILPYL
jgi:hypothetical protein